MIVRLAPGKIDEYRELHRNVWPGVVEMIHACHISSYSIYYMDGFLFSYYEYDGDNYERDMQKMAEDPTTKQWWALCEPCLNLSAIQSEGGWWAVMEEVFHLE